MSTINENLRTFLLSSPEVTALVDTKIYEQHVPVRDDSTGEPDIPFIWYAVGSTSVLRTTDAEQGEQPFQYQFDIELVSGDVAETVVLANVVRDFLDDYRGAFGGQIVQAVLVEDQNDQYIVRNPTADLGLSVASLAVTIIPWSN